jgi:hypothetical protein
MIYLTMRKAFGDILKWAPVGSRVTCMPAPTDTDDDYLVLVSPYEHAAFVEGLCLHQGYKLGGSRPEADGGNPFEGLTFESYTKGETNLIVTRCPVFYERFMCATRAAKQLNILDKRERISLFQDVLYGDAHA